MDYLPGKISINWKLNKLPSKFTNQFELELTIADNGKGMSAERCREVNEKLNALGMIGPDQEVLDQGESSHGEGIYNSTRFIFKQGGRFYYTINPEGGTTAHIHLYVDVQD